MPQPLISTNDLISLRGGSVLFNGYVWDPSGFLLSVNTRNFPMSKSIPDFPNERTLGVNKNTTFFTNYKEVTISLVDIGNDDVLYDDQGRFICALTGEGKGQIKIKKINMMKNMLDMKPWKSGNSQNRIHHDIVDIKDVTLTAEAYSKIFTHIISLMKDVDLNKYISNNIISVEVYNEKGKMVDLFGKSSARNDSEPFAFFTPSDSTVTAVVNKGSDSHMETYGTIWNIQNTLGAHEIRGHAEKRWNDAGRVHHLVYAFQMGHPSWKKTTEEFKKAREKNFYYYIDEVKSEYDMNNPPGSKNNDELSKFYRQGQKDGIFPKELKSQTDSVKYLNNLINFLRKNQAY